MHGRESRIVVRRCELYLPLASRMALLAAAGADECRALDQRHFMLQGGPGARFSPPRTTMRKPHRL